MAENARKGPQTTRIIRQGMRIEGAWSIILGPQNQAMRQCTPVSLLS
jgi:hypothetical protein